MLFPSTPKKPGSHSENRRQLWRTGSRRLTDWLCPGAVQLTCLGQSDISHVTMSYLSKLIILYWMLMDLRDFYCLMLNRTLVDWLHDTSYITSQDISLNFLNLLRFRTEHRSPWNPCPGPQVYNTQCLYCFVRFRSNHDVKNRYFYSSIQCEFYQMIFSGSSICGDSYLLLLLTQPSRIITSLLLARCWTQTVS